MTTVERVHNALRLQPVDRTPVTGTMTSVTVELMDLCGVSWPEAHFDADKMVTLAAAAHEHYGLESMKLPFDMAVEAEALGGDIDFGNRDTLPQIKGHFFEEPEELQFDRGLLSKGRIPIVLRAIGIAKQRYGNNVAMVSSIVGPFTLATRLFGIEPVLIWMAAEPESLMAAMEATTKLCIMYAKEQALAGSDVLQIGEAASSGDLISGDDYGRFIAPFHKQLCGEVPIPTVIHICGNISGHLPYIRETGMSAISLDEQADMAATMQALKGRTAVVGYIPTLEVLLNGTPGQVAAKARECLEAGVDMLNAGCAWPPHVPGENLRAMIDTAIPSNRR